MTGTLLGAVAKIGDVTDKMLKYLGVTRSKVEDMLSKTKSTNLIEQVAGNVSVFPIVITNDVPVQPASLITQMCELEMANYLALALASSPRVSIGDINDGKYLQKYHTNLRKLDAEFGESFDWDNIVEASIGRALADSVASEIDLTQRTQNQLTMRMNESLRDYGGVYGLDWLMEAKKPSEGSEANYRAQRTHQHTKTTNELGDHEDSVGREKRDRDYRNDIQDSYRRERKERSDSRSEARGIVGDVISAAKTASSETRAWMQYKNEREREKKQDQREEEQTVDQHVSREFSKTYGYKKINEMQPTPVTARIFTVDNNGTPSRAIDVVSGVKANLHPINKSELISLLQSSEKGNMLVKIIRFTTGELSFFKDILFNSDSIKSYAEKMGKFHSAGAKVLSTLKRVKDLNRTGKNVKPNATLVVSKAAVEELKRTIGFDLLDNETAINLCNDLSLIKLIVSDPLGGKLHIIMPGMSSEYSVMSTDTLDKQVDATMDAPLTKELRKVISKGE